MYLFGDKYMRPVSEQIQLEYPLTGVHKSFHPTIRDGSTWSKFGARGEHGDVLRFTTEVFSGSPTCKLTVVDV